MPPESTPPRRDETVDDGLSLATTEFDAHSEYMEPTPEPGRISPSPPRSVVVTEDLWKRIVYQIVLASTPQCTLETLAEGDSPESEFARELVEYRFDIQFLQHTIEEIQKTKPRKLEFGNYSIWKTKMEDEALMLGARDILFKKQREPPPGSTPLQYALWMKKNDTMYTRYFQSLSPSIRSAIGASPSGRAVELWLKIQDFCGERAAKRRFTLVRDLVSLKVEDDDFPQYLHKHKEIIGELRQIGATVEDFFHDLFILGLGDWERDFVHSQLDEFFLTGTSTRPIKNLDIEDLMWRLSNRASFKSLQQGYSSEDSESSIRCNHCGKCGHISDNCWRKYPEKAPARRRGRGGNRGSSSRRRRN